MKRRGLLIVFEGLDGAGKGTQLELFRKYLHQQNLQGESSQIKIFQDNLSQVYSTKNQQFDLFSMFLKEESLPYSTYDFPRYYDNFWGGMVGRMLNKEFGDQIDPYLRSTFYLLDQGNAGKQIRKDLAQGKIVVCNRYITSSYIFQSALIQDPEKKKEYVNWLETAGYKHLGIVRPDIVIALYVDPVKAQELIAKKAARQYTNGKAKDLNEENLELQKNAAKEMLRFCKERREWKLIDCMDGENIRRPEEIAQLIRDTLQERLLR
jgi:thymidylate kinase